MFFEKQVSGHRLDAVDTISLGDCRVSLEDCRVLISSIQSEMAPMWRVPDDIAALRLLLLYIKSKSSFLVLRSHEIT